MAELRAVCWLDIQGKMPTQMLSLKTTYAAYLVYKLGEDSYGLEVVAKAFVGFTEATSSVSNTEDTSIGTDMSASNSLVDTESNSIYLSPSAHRRRDRRPGWRRLWYPVPGKLNDGRIPQRRLDGWLEIFLGEFFNDEGEGAIEIKILETTVLNWKRGLILEGMELRPKEDA